MASLSSLKNDLTLHGIDCNLLQETIELDLNLLKTQFSISENILSEKEKLQSKITIQNTEIFLSLLRRAIASRKI